MSNYTPKELKTYFDNAYSVKDTIQGTSYFKKLLIEKVLSIFVFEDLPYTLDSVAINKMLLLLGFSVVVEVDGKLYTPEGMSIYGYNVDSVPIMFTYANPIIGSGKGVDLVNGVIGYNSHIDKVLAPSEPSSMLYQTIERYANMLAHVESTLVNLMINKRSSQIGIASTNAMAQAINNVLDKLESGQVRAVQSDTGLVDRIQSLQLANNHESVGELTQVRDYIMNCFLNEIGIQTLEEKKERMITGEINNDKEMLANNLQSMYQARLEFINKVNYVFKTDIKLRLNLSSFEEVSTNEI